MLTKYDTRKNMKTFIFIFQFHLLEPRSICGNTFSFIFRRVPATKSTVNCMLYLDSTTCYKIFNRLLNFMLRPPVCYNTKHMYPNYNNYHRIIYMYNSWTRQVQAWPVLSPCKQSIDSYYCMISKFVNIFVCVVFFVQWKCQLFQ